MKKKILIVEDDESSLILLRAFLSRKGFEVHTCRSVEKASEMLLHESFDIHLIDLMLQGSLSGEVLISAGIKPTIVMSALDINPADLEAVVFLQKPYILDSLLHLINAMIPL